MRSDIVAVEIFPDYPLPDHTGAVRTLSDLRRSGPLFLTSIRGHCYGKAHQQYLELAAFQSKIAVACTGIVTASTDEHHTLASRASTAFGTARGEK
jgi:hypothetical protein